MDKIMKEMLGMLLEIDPDGIKKLAAKEFVEFLKNSEIPFEVKVIELIKIDMDDVINHLDAENVEFLNEKIQHLHKGVNKLFKELEEKTA